MTRAESPWLEAGRFAATLRDRIDEELRDRILGGVYESGLKLDLDELAVEFGSSRTPVREALIQLSQDGLVEMIPRRGVRVLGLSLESIQDNFDVFGALSGIAAGWTAERADSELLDRLATRKRALDEAQGDHSLATANWEFHREIHRACGSSRLRSVMQNVSKLMPAGYFRLIPSQVDVSAAEHQLLLNAIQQRDKLAARELAEDHVRAAGRQMVEVLKSQGRH